MRSQSRALTVHSSRYYLRVRRASSSASASKFLLRDAADKCLQSIDGLKGGVEPLGSDHQSAIHMQGLAGDVARSRRCQESNCRRRELTLLDQQIEHRPIAARILNGLIVRKADEPESADSTARLDHLSQYGLIVYVATDGNRVSLNQAGPIG